jgi:uncharacterized protein (DUF302 family)
MTGNEKRGAGLVASRVTTQHISIATGLTYDDLVRGFERELGRWDLAAADRLLKSNASWSEVEREVDRMAGPRGLMIFTRINQGEIISLSGESKRCSLYLVGNPVIANKIIGIDIRGSFYVPFRVCLYDSITAGSAVISYDRPSSLLAGLEQPELNEISIMLDEKIDGVVNALRKT